MSSQTKLLSPQQLAAALDKPFPPTDDQLRTERALDDLALFVRRRERLIQSSSTLLGA